MWMWHYTVDGRNPAPPFGSIKPVVNNGMFTYIYHINWCRISEPSTVSTVPTCYHLEKPTTTLSPLRGKIQIQATHLPAKTEVQVSFEKPPLQNDISSAMMIHTQKKSSKTVDDFNRYPLNLDLSLFKKRVPSSWWTHVVQEEFAQQIHNHMIPSLFQLRGARFGLTNEGPTVRGQATTGGHILGTWHDWHGGMVLWKIWVFPKIGGKPPKWMGANNRKPY